MKFRLFAYQFLNSQISFFFKGCLEKKKSALIGIKFKLSFTSSGMDASNVVVRPFNVATDYQQVIDMFVAGMQGARNPLAVTGTGLKKNPSILPFL